MAHTFFSIVIVSLNPGQKLMKTLQSVLRQEYGNFEVILKDGGSTDGSLKEEADGSLSVAWPGQSVSDSRVHIFRSPDKGIYDQTDGGNGISDAYGNKISASYTNDNGDMRTVDSGNVKVNVTKPYISKTGTIDSANKTVEWTITVNLGDFYDESGTFDEAVSYLESLES